ncbi:MAG: dipeptidase PepE [Ginsengibacter sp.]
MSPINILALSSSRSGKSGYLETAAPVIENFLGDEAISIAFIAFASADKNYEEYSSKVRKALKKLPHIIHTVFPQNAASVITKSNAIMVGGGNTFKLLHDLYQLNLIEVIQKKVNSGTPYIGWSAGANITGLTIGTTNDMPVIEPKSFKALGLLPFQINPHYVNQKAEGFNGETRNQRLEEFMKMNPDASIVCLPEGTFLQRENNILKYNGKEPAVLFYSKESEGTFSQRMIPDDSDLSYLL